MDDAEQARHRGLRQLLEDDFRELVKMGLLVDVGGDRELVFRLDKDGNIKWLTTTRWRVPASELESSAS